MSGYLRSASLSDAERQELALRISRLLHDTRLALEPERLDKVFVTLTEDNGLTVAPDRYLFDIEAFSDYESHAFYEVGLQVDGTSLLQLDSLFYELRPGQLAIVRRNQVHRLAFPADTNAPSTMFWLNVTGDMTRCGFTTYDRESPWKVWGCDLMIPGGFILSEALDKVGTKAVSADQRDAIATCLRFFFLELERRFVIIDTAEEQSWNEQIVVGVKHYVLTHLNSTLRLQELSDVLSVSACHLSKVFKQVTNQTLSSYIQSVKLEKSIEHLLLGTMTISEIASKLGYYDQYHFSKAFKSFTGFAPTVYRQYHAAERANPAHCDE